MSNPAQKIDTGVIIRRSLFLLILIALTLVNLFTLFRGLNSSTAMDQAQISREIARGNGYTTKFIRPVAYEKAVEHQKSNIPFVGFKDTYHSPLNPLLNAAVFKLIGADNADKWRMNEKQRIYPLDRVIATVSTLCFLVSIGVCYLLISRIFDAKIAGVTAILMLFCNVFWEFSLSGLPQMLMLLLFSCALFFAYRAVEESSEGRAPFIPAIIAAVFFTLLSLTHYLTIWIALGYIIFAATFFRPRGIVGIAALVVLLVPSVFILLRNNSIDGSPFGIAFLNLYNGMGGGREDIVMRALNIDSYPLLGQGFVSSIIQTTLTQTVSLIPFLAGIIVAPLFFLSLLHPFRRPSIATFRWAILIMFGISAFGLSIFGISLENLDPNQTHLLFAPIMTAYGLAFVSILWNKLPSVISNPILKNLHFIVIIGICALPLLLSLPRKVQMGLENNTGGGIPHWPPYWAPALNLGLNKWLTEKQIIFADQPWAVAWYADRVSVWLPMEKKDFTTIESRADALETPVSGILISPTSHGDGSITQVAAKYKDFTSFVLDGRVFLATYPPGISIYDQDQKIKDIAQRYSFRTTIVGMDMVYYSNRALREKKAN